MRTIAEGIGWLVIIMFVLGALDIANFRLSFKAKDGGQSCPPGNATFTLVDDPDRIDQLPHQRAEPQHQGE